MWKMQSEQMHMIAALLYRDIAEYSNHYGARNTDSEGEQKDEIEQNQHSARDSEPRNSG